MIFINYFIFVHKYLTHVPSAWGYQRPIDMAPVHNGFHSPVGETKDPHMKIVSCAGQYEI